MSNLQAALIALPPTIAAVAGLVTAWRTGRRVDEVHLAVNSRLDALLAAEKSVSRAEGVSQGHADRRTDDK